MKTVNRVLIYAVGMLFLGAGIALNTKTGLGVTPMVSISFSISQLFGLKFGDATFFTYVIFVALQFLLRGRNSHWYDLLQLPAGLVFGQLLNLISGAITYDSGTHSFVWNLLLLLVSMSFTGIGAAMTVNMSLIPNPGDGLFAALSERTGWEHGFAKNMLDVGCLVFTSILGLVFAGKIIGISIGTLMAMVCVGRVIAVTNKLFKRKMLSAAGLD